MTIQEQMAHLAPPVMDWTVPAQMLYQPQKPDRDYVEQRQAITEGLAVALGRPSAQWGMSAATSDALLMLARLHYQYGMAPEGLSVLQGLDAANLSDTQSLRRATLELALGIVDPRGIPLTAAAQAMLEQGYAEWPDQMVFVALKAVQERRFTDSADLLGVVRDKLNRLPSGYQAVVLPGLLEAAIATEQWRIARDFALEFRKHPGMAQGSAFRYLLGRAAEAGHDILAAFDSYALAGEQNDLFGHRARMAIVSLGLANSLLTIPEARDLLARESNLWRGDDYALAVLTDLAALDQASGDRVAAIHTYGTIIDRFPAAPEAGLSRQKARALIAEVYEEGATGKMPLSDFLIAHRTIAPDFRFEPGFDAQSERFANRFLAVGSTLVAAQEYEAVHDHLAVARDLGLAEVDDQRLDELRLKQARALSMGGQMDVALSVLREPLLSADPELDNQRSQLLARLYSETGQTAAVLETQIADPSLSFLRIKAKAHFDRADWAGAQATYQQMWDLIGNELPMEDAIPLLLSAYRNSDLATTVALSRAFPDLTEIPQWTAIAGGLVDPAAELWPLRQDTAKLRINSASEAMDNVGTVVPGTN
jgi:hypothetical protein